jgi:hypothetical protein
MADDPQEQEDKSMDHMDRRRGPETVNVCLRLPRATVEHLRALAREFSVERGRDISYTDLVRQAVGRMYPPEDSVREP